MVLKQKAEQPLADSASATAPAAKKHKASSDAGAADAVMTPDKKVHVSLLAGFLGAGKTTLLKHILETKHGEEGAEPFRCAVIVNDMAELNIDKALIDRSAMVQSDEVVAMQNGCVCCTLKSDMVEQVKDLAKSGRFDYMIVEASGISEPCEIASMFAECEDEHDHEQEHKEPALSDYAVLDTCVTVVSAGEFFENFATVTKTGAHNKAWPKLLIEQIEYANVVVINKTDLVTEEQLATIEQHVAVLNPGAKVLKSHQSVIDVKEVINTNLYDAKAFKEGPDVDIEDDPSCCKEAIKRGESPCCRRARTFQSALSTVMLGSKKLPKTRHEKRFGIRSFTYTARRPFHPRRLMEQFITKYFTFVEENDDDEEDDDGEEEGDGEAGAPEADAAASAAAEAGAVEDGSAEAAMDPEEQKQREEERKRKLQEESKQKQALREKELGGLLRSKGFIWTAHTHDLMGIFGQAGNTVTVDCAAPWACLDLRAYEGTEEEKKILRKDWVAPWGDRRQELVFIGHDMDHGATQKALDACLLTDEEYSLGIDGWKATMGDVFLFGDFHVDNGDDDDAEAGDEKQAAEKEQDEAVAKA